MLAGRDIRRRWRTVVVLTLMVGVVGAVVVATVAGARRTDSAFGRFNVASRSADVFLFTGDATSTQLQDFGRVQGVAATAVLHAFAIAPVGAPNSGVAAAVDTTFGSAVDRARIVAGRAANPLAVDEVTIGEGLARLLRVGLGATSIPRHSRRRRWRKPPVVASPERRSARVCGCGSLGSFDDRSTLEISALRGDASS